MSEVKKLNYTINPQRGTNPLTKKEEIKVWVNFNDLDQKEAMALQKRGMQWTRKDPTSAKSPINNLNLPNPFAKVQLGLETLAKMGYEVPSIEQIKEEVVEAFKEAPTSEEIAAAEQTTDDKWVEFMQHVNDEQVQSVLRSLGMSAQRGDNTYGHIYSRENAISAIAQKPNATFVLTKKDWRQRFGRRVKDDAQRIILFVPTGHGKANAKEKIDFVNTGALGKDRTYQGLSGHEKHFVDVKANNRSAHSFFSMVYYDVSDTELIDPNGEDLWANTVGLESNLTGKLNQQALADKAANMGQGEGDASVIYNNNVGDLEKTTIALAKFIEAKYKKIDVKNLNVKNERTFGLMVEQLAHFLLEKEGKVVKPENRTSSVNIIKSMVFALTNVHPEYVASQLQNNILTMDEYYALRNFINTIVNGINKFLPINENRIFVMEQFKLLSSVDELLGMLGISKEEVKRHEMESMKNDAMVEQKEITEGFNKFYKRLMDNKKWN